MAFPLPERQLEVTASMKILQPHLKASTGWAVRFMHHKGLLENYIRANLLTGFLKN
jgi:hypothetical protein